MEWSEIAALVRAYAEAIAEGRIEARQIAEMTNDQLRDFRKEKLASLEEKQREAENLAKHTE